MGKKVSITYSGLSRKITNTITYLDFVQENSVSDELRECRYLLHFEDKDGNRVSDETTIVANLTSEDIKDRYFKEKFVFKNISYNKDAKYSFLFARDIKEANKEELGKIVIESGNLHYNYLYARYIKGADIKKHAQVVIKSGDLEANYNFATSVKWADKEAHAQVLIDYEKYLQTGQYWTDIYTFFIEKIKKIQENRNKRNDSYDIPRKEDNELCQIKELLLKL